MTKAKNLLDYLIVLDKKDNVGTAGRDILPGSFLIEHNGDSNVVKISKRVKAGFKLALCRIDKRKLIYKFGQPIGRAASHINAGCVVHVHNIRSLIKKNA